VKVVVLPQALERMRRTLELVYPDAGDLVRDRIIDRVFDHIGLLARYPGLGQPEPDLASLGLGHRRLIVGHFKVIYRIDGELVVVLDIFDSRRDPVTMRK